MNKLKLNSNVVEAINTHYTDTTTKGGPLNWLVTSDPEQSLFDVIVAHFVEDVYTRSTFDRQKVYVDGLVEVLRVSFPAHSEVFREASVFIEQFADEKEAPTKREGVIHKQVVTPYLDSLFGSQKLLTSLSLETGCLPADLIRDLHGLSKLKEGIIEVGPCLSRKQSNSRTITFDPSKVQGLDEDDLVLDIVKRAVFTEGNVGLVSRRIGKLLKGLKYNFYQLRASYIVHSRQSGMAWKEIAERVGVKGGITFQQRYIDLAAKNGIEID